MSPLLFQSWILLLVLSGHALSLIALCSVNTITATPPAGWLVGLLCAALVAWTVGGLARLQRCTIVPVPGLLVLSYLLFAITSWLYRYRANRFPGILDFELVEYLFHPYTITVIEPGLGLLATLVMVFALVTTLILIRNAPSRTPSMTSTLTPLLLVGALLFIPLFKLPSSALASLPEAAFLVSIQQRLNPTSVAHWFKAEPAYKSAKTDLDGPSVLILVVEALRRDMISERYENGEPVMPFLSSLSMEGTSYPQAYAQASDSEMSRVAILSGRYPLQRGLRPTMPPRMTLLSFLRERGYKTGFFSTFEGGWGGLTLDFVDYVSDPTLDGGALALKQSIEKGEHRTAHPQELVFRLDTLNEKRFDSWLDSQADTHKIGGYFVLYGSHFPYSGKLGAAVSSYFFPPEATAQVKAEYTAALTRTDQILLRVFNKMRARHPDSLIVITGDHGEEFYEHGGYLHAGQLSAEVMNVPMFILGLPDRCPKPGGVTQPVGHIDLTPTILDILGDRNGLAFQGTSLCEQVATNRPLFASARALRLEDALILDGWKYVTSLDGYESKIYDLRSDPKELNNLTADYRRLSQGASLIENFRGGQRMYYAMSDYIDIQPPRYDAAWVRGLRGSFDNLLVPATPAAQ